MTQPIQPNYHAMDLNCEVASERDQHNIQLVSEVCSYVCVLLTKKKWCTCFWMHCKSG